jgi:hypothetical protein
LEANNLKENMDVDPPLEHKRHTEPRMDPSRVSIPLINKFGGSNGKLYLLLILRYIQQ